MPKIEIYSTAICPYCVAAKNLLKSRGLDYQEVRVDTDPAARKTMLERSHGARSVPQIFINGEYIGGYEQLAEASHSGRLAALTGR